MKIVILLILLLSNISYASELSDEILKIAPKYTGFKESYGPNQGPEVNKILKAAGLPPGQPWCMALVYSINLEASNNIHKANPVLRTGASYMYYKYALKNPFRYKVISPMEVMLGTELKPGDTVIHQRGKIRKDGSFPGHAAVVIKQINEQSYMSLEGNTFISTNGGDQGEGDTSGYKTRKISPNGKFRQLGFIRYVGDK